MSLQSATMGGGAWTFRAPAPKKVPIATPKPVALVPVAKTAPPGGLGLRPGAQAQEANLLGQMGALDASLGPKRTAEAGNLRRALSGFGGWSVNENGDAVFDPNARPGERERAAVWGERAQANARGMLHSSAGNQAVGAALSRLSLEAQQIVTQYAGRLEQLNNDTITQRNPLATQLLDLYGSEGAWMLEQAPPPPLPPGAPHEPQPVTNQGPGAPLPTDTSAGTRFRILGPWATKPKKVPAGYTLVPNGNGKWVAVPSFGSINNAY